jgi:hypothetical protein
MTERAPPTRVSARSFRRGRRGRFDDAGFAFSLHPGTALRRAHFQEMMREMPHWRHLSIRFGFVKMRYRPAPDSSVGGKHVFFD